MTRDGLLFLLLIIFGLCVAEGCLFLGVWLMPWPWGEQDKPDWAKR